MESDTFDNLVRSAVKGASRRGVVRVGVGALTASALVTMGLRTDDAAARKNKKKKKRKKVRCTGATPVTCGAGCCPSTYSQCCPATLVNTPPGTVTCNPSSFTCCSAELGGGSCSGGAPTCCPPTRNGTLSGCAAANEKCCTAAQGGGACLATETCCPPNLSNPQEPGICCPAGQQCCIGGSTTCPSGTTCSGATGVGGCCAPPALRGPGTQWRRSGTERTHILAR